MNALEIKDLRLKTGLTQEEAGALINRDRVSIAQIESGRTKSDGRIAKELIAALNEYLTNGSNTTIATSSNNQKNSGIKSNAKFSEIGVAEFRYLPIAAQAGYIRGIIDTVHTSELQTIPLMINVPNPDNYLAIQVADDSMKQPHDDFKGAAEGDLLLCKQLPLETNLTLHKNKLFVIALGITDKYPEGGLLFKKLQSHDRKENVAHFISTTDGYPTYDIDMKDIKQLWYVKFITPIHSY